MFQLYFFLHALEDFFDYTKFEELDIPDEYLDAEAVEQKPRVKPLTLKNVRSHESKTRDDGEPIRKVEDDLRSQASARSVLSDHKGLRQIHSARSLQQLAKQVAKRSGLPPIDEGGFLAKQEPRIVTINEDEGVRQNVRKLPSNLPYMHRNPAV